MRRFYPAFLALHGRRCVVVGGGAVAQRKVGGLLAAGAEVVVISPTVTRRLAGWARAGRIERIARRFRRGDLWAAWLAIAATDEPAINRTVMREAQRRRVWINVVDQPALCTFIAPSIATRGPVTVAVSTGGASPTLAKHVRRTVQGVLGASMPRLARMLASLRPAAKQALPSYADRKRYFDRVMEGPVPALVEAGRLAEARRQAMSLLKQCSSSRTRSARS